MKTQLNYINKRLWILLLVFISIPVLAEEYRLIRSSIIFDNGQVFDTSLKNLIASGSMTIEGNLVTQRLLVNLNGNETSLAVEARIIAIDSSGVLITTRDNLGRDTSTVLLETGSIIETLFNTGTSAEVDRWQLIPQSKSIKQQKSYDLDKDAKLGSLFTRLLQENGLTLETP